MQHSRSRLASFLVVFGIAFAAASSAEAQTFTGSLTTGAGRTWFRPGASCVPEAQTRLYERFAVFANNPGTYTFTATRTSGTGIMIDAFRVFPSTNCQVERYNDGVVGSSTTASVTVVVANTSLPILLVVSSTSTQQTGGYSVTVAGPSTVSGDCSGTGTLSTTSQSAPIGGGMYSTTYTPPAGVACSGWTISGTPTWITGMPAAGGGTTTIAYTVASNTLGPRSASISIGRRTLTVNQAGTCNYSLSPTSTTVSGAGGQFGVNVVVNSGCPWTATTATPWITIADPSGTGGGTLSFTFAENTGAARVGTINVAGATLTVNQNARCTYALDTSNVNLAATPSTPVISVTTQVGCRRTGTSNVAWITPVASGLGNGTSSFQVAANTGPARSGTFTIGEDTVAVNQASGCVVALPVAARSVAAAGTSSSFMVNTGAGCTFTAGADVAWLTAAPDAGGVDFTVAPSIGAMRVGTITVTSTSTTSSAAYVVTQSSGCVPELAAMGETVGAVAGIGAFGVTIDGGCSYTATSDAAWVHSIAQNGSGIEFAVDANDGPERTGTINVSAEGGSVAYAITQTTGCTVSVADTTLTLDPTGDARFVEVVTGAGCTWSVAASSDWIVTSDGGLITVEANDDAARTGTLIFTSVESGATDSVTVEQASGVAPPFITVQPVGDRVFVGDYVTLIVQASSDRGFPEYQWRKDGVPIPFATSNGFDIIGADLEDAGDYDVVVSNIGGSVTSDVATIEVVPPNSGGCAAAPGAGSGGPSALAALAMALAWGRRRLTRRGRRA